MRLRLVMMVLLIHAGVAEATADVVAVVSANSPVTTLTQRQITDIFLGKTSVFPSGAQAVPIDLAEGAPARDEFYAKLTGKSPAQIKAYWSKIIFTGKGQPPQEASNGLEVKRRLAENPNAISYMEQHLVDSRVRVLYAP